MHRSLGRRALPLAGALLAGVAVTAALVMPALGSTSRTVVKTEHNTKLGHTVLVTLKGMTLYHLTAEHGGKFICTGQPCLSFWTPLTVPKGTTPTGVKVHSLSTIKRPDGRWQVTYKGSPLYTFKGDHKPGDVKGNGFKDVGTWLTLSVSGASSSPPPPPTTTGYGYGSGGGGGY